ncbi:hypothetical protein PV387_38355, partial [Streptomyces sp. ME02-6987-2C]|nr:hypothetical protein [Streptomyces sp. ME02-6987-2C]
GWEMGIRDSGAAPPGTSTAQAAVVGLGGAALGAVVVGVPAHTGRVGASTPTTTAHRAAAGVLGLLRVRVYGPARLRRTGARTPAPRRAGRGARAWAVVRRARTVVRRARAGVSQASRGATGVAGGASFRAAIFPVRQATSTENVQVGAPLRVRNG